MKKVAFWFPIFLLSPYSFFHPISPQIFLLSTGGRGITSEKYTPLFTPPPHLFYSTEFLEELFIQMLKRYLIEKLSL